VKERIPSRLEIEEILNPKHEILNNIKNQNTNDQTVWSLDFGIWNLVSGIATPRQVGARNDVWCVVARLTKSAEAISGIATHLSGARNDSKVEGLLAMTNGVS